MPLLYETNDELLTVLRNAGMIPDTKSAGTRDADLLEHASNGIRSFLAAKIVSALENYYVVRRRVSITSGQVRFDLPSRTMWQKLRKLWHVMGGARREINLRREEDLPACSPAGGGNIPWGYMFEGDHLLLLPDTGSFSGELELVFYAAPGDLVPTSEARLIEAVDAGTMTVTLASAAPSGWSTDELFDVHSPNAGAELRDFDMAASLVSGTDLTFTNAIDGSVFGTRALRVGDWVTLAGEVAVPPVMRELQPILVQVAAMQVAVAHGDREKADQHGKLIGAFMQEQVKMLEQRVETEPVRIGGRQSLMGSSRFRRRY